MDRKAGLVEVPTFGSPYANSVSTHVGYDLVDEYHQRAHAKRNAWTRYENVLLRVVKVQIVEGAYYERWKDAVAEAEIDDNWPRVVIARSEVRQEILGERRTMALLGYGDAYTRVLHASDPPPGVKTDLVQRCVETCSVVAVLPPKKSKAAKQKLKLAAKASIDHYTGKIIGEKVLTSKMRETATEPGEDLRRTKFVRVPWERQCCSTHWLIFTQGEDGPTSARARARREAEDVCWSAACWEPEDGNANMLHFNWQGRYPSRIVVGPWAGSELPGQARGPLRRRDKEERGGRPFHRGRRPRARGSETGARRRAREQRRPKDHPQRTTQEGAQPADDGLRGEPDEMPLCYREEARRARGRFAHFFASPCARPQKRAEACVRGAGRVLAQEVVVPACLTAIASVQLVRIAFFGIERDAIAFR